MPDECRLSKRQIAILFRLYDAQTEISGKFHPVLVADLAAQFGETYTDFANLLDLKPMPRYVTTSRLFTDPDNYSVVISECGAAFVEHILDDRRQRRRETLRFIIGLFSGWILSSLGTPKDVFRFLSQLFS